jgi:hypothetical protein
MSANITMCPLLSIRFPPQEQNVSKYGIGAFPLIWCANCFEATLQIDSVWQSLKAALHRGTAPSDIDAR